MKQDFIRTHLYFTETETTILQGFLARHGGVRLSQYARDILNLAEDDELCRLHIVPKFAGESRAKSQRAVLLTPELHQRAEKFAARMQRSLQKYLRGLLLCPPPRRMPKVASLSRVVNEPAKAVDENKEIERKQIATQIKVDRINKKIVEAAHAVGIRNEDQLLLALENLRATGWQWLGDHWKTSDQEPPLDFDGDEALRELRQKLVDSTTSALRCLITVRFAKGEEALIERLMHKSGLPLLTYMRTCALSEGRLEVPKKMSNGIHHKVYLAPEDLTRLKNLATQAKMKQQHYVRCRVLAGFEARDLFDEGGDFKLWKL